MQIWCFAWTKDVQWELYVRKLFFPSFMWSLEFFVSSIPFQKADSTVIIPCRYNISPCNPFLPELMCWDTWLAVQTKDLFTTISSSFVYFSPNTMKPSPPSTAVFLLGGISKGTISRMIRNSPNHPCKCLLNLTHLNLSPAARCAIFMAKIPRQPPRQEDLPPTFARPYKDFTHKTMQQGMPRNEEQGIQCSLSSW